MQVHKINNNVINTVTVKIHKSNAHIIHINIKNYEQQDAPTMITSKALTTYYVIHSLTYAKFAYKTEISYNFNNEIKINDH